MLVKATAIASSAGSSVRAFEGPIDVRWFGAKNDNSADAQPGIQAAVDLAEVIGSAITETPVRRRVGPAGWYQTGATITLSKSIAFHLEGVIRYTPTTGKAVVMTTR